MNDNRPTFCHVKAPSKDERIEQLRASLAASQAEVERLRAQWEELLVEIEELTDELPGGKESLEDVVAAVKLMCDQRDDAGNNCGLYWAEIERLRGIIRDVLDNFDFGDKTTINYMVERLQEAK